jgi:hypothetical protein
MLSRFASPHFLVAFVLTVALPSGASAASAPTAASAAVAPAVEDTLPFEAAVFLGCDKLPAGPRAVRLALPAQGSPVAVRDVIGLMSRLSCSPVEASAGVTLETRVDVTSPPAPVSAREAFSIMDAALTSAGLVLQAEKTGPARFQLFVRPRTDDSRR